MRSTRMSIDAGECLRLQGKVNCKSGKKFIPADLRVFTRLLAPPRRSDSALLFVRASPSVLDAVRLTSVRSSPAAADSIRGSTRDAPASA